MKKLRSVLVLVLAIIIFTGCTMKAEYNMKIKSDKSMDFAVIMAFDDEFLEGMLSMKQEDNQTGEYTEKEKWAYIESSINDLGSESPEELGFKKEKYEKDGFMGYKFVKTISSIDDISGNEIDFDISEFQRIEDTTMFIKEGEKYKANFVLSNENAEEAESIEGMENIENMFDIKFVVTLPNKPIKHNATETSNGGKTLTWSLLEERSKNVEFEFEVKPSNDLIIYISIGVILLVIIAVAVIFVNKNKKNNNLINQSMQSNSVSENQINNN